MPITLPPEPRFAHHTEKAVFTRLHAQLLDEDLLVVGQRVTDHQKDHEADFVVAIDGAGILCVEVKGGEVRHDGDGWLQRRPDGSYGRIDPVAQARDSCYALRNFVEADPRWTHGRVRWDHAVVLPNTELPADFGLPDCPRWKVIDRTQLDQLMPLLRRIVLEKHTTAPGIDALGVAQLQTILAGRGLPQRDVVARALANEDAADALTQEQAVILGAIRQLHRVQVRGGAGSGKTFLAVEQARRLAHDGQRVALLCYSHGLASLLKRLTASWPHRDRLAYVGEFHDLGLRWGAPEGPDERIRNEGAARFWEHDLPREMTRLAEQLPPGMRFDAIVVDEAQDFADEWWPPVLAALRDPQESGLYVFSDEAQRVFDRHGSPPVPLVPLVLDHNLRNTRQIATTFGPLADQRMQLRGGDGPQVAFIACSPAEACSVADDQIDVLIDAGWRPEDIALLTTGARHPEQVERQDQGNAKYWDSFWDTDQVFYGHVLGFKGLERRVVVLALNEPAATERSRERLYVGLSRAREQLVICGDPELVRAVGGPEVATRLGL
ncbi:MAG: NERD domain-containing protein/DEAD/DEAH box helicase [Gordonia sp. (in: high G+C Gram-positive bacteria)]|uniref:NERD domain-containing protein n=1 Tax=Gordonia sp. (in: high G+C Gram-positive bacteria) TaxID=84139 RepID=UPI003BB5DB83